MQRESSCRALRWLVTLGLLTTLLNTLDAAAPVRADKPGGVPPPNPALAAKPGRDPRLPDPAAEQAWFASIRQAPPGVSPAQARAKAQQQATALPTRQTLVGGKGAAGPQRDSTTIFRELGPASEDSDTVNPNHDYQVGRVSGRATAVVVGPHTGVIYLGTAGGGVWKSTNDGASWTPLTDTQLSLAIGALALDPADATDNTLYAGTGEANYVETGYNGDAYFGIGVLKTTDGGAHWTLQGTGFPNFNVYGATSVGIGALVANGTTVYAGTTKGLYRSTDGGANWSRITVNAGDANFRVTEVIVDGSTVWAVLSQSFNGSSTAGVYKSTTGGGTGTYTAQMTGMPGGTTWGRAQLAIARSTPTTLYLAIATGINVGDTLLGIYKTTDSGAHWAQTTAQPPDYLLGNGDYANTIAVDPADANRVYAGGLNQAASTDGGAHWSVIVDATCGFTLPCHAPVLAAVHAAAFAGSGTPRPLYVATGGGIWKTANGGGTWTDLNANLATIQFIGGDAAFNYLFTPVVVGGADNNGTSRTGSPAGGVWNAILGGNTGHVALDKVDPNIVYSEYSASLLRTTNANAGSAIAWTDISPITAGCIISLYYPPFALDPNDRNHLIFGGQGLCETMDGGAHWATSNAALIFAATSGIQSVAIAPTNSAVLYAATDAGYVYKTTNGHTGAAATWTDCASGFLPAGPMTALAVDPTNVNTVYATFGNFGTGHVFKTSDCTSWQRIDGTLPDTPVTSILYLNGQILVGTDVGLFLSVDNGVNWTKFVAGLPNAPIMQIFIDAAQTTLFVATHGRGMWKIDLFGGTPPTITAVSPNNGPPAGGNQVTITGTNFANFATVLFDATPGTNVVVHSATSMTVTVPAHAAGQVDVTVVNTDARGVDAPLAYTYGTLSTLPGVKPAGGSGSGSGSPDTQPNPRPAGPAQGGSVQPIPPTRP